MKQVTIFTDGSAWPNPGGPGGWGAVLLFDGQRLEVKGSIPAPTTNNRAELTAALGALDVLTWPSEVDLYTDSQYLRNGAAIWFYVWQRRGFRNVKNLDLWERISAKCAIHRIRWHWVRGHSDCAENNRCDELADQMRARE